MHGQGEQKMVEIKINASELKDGDIIAKFSSFLKDKTGAEVTTDSKTLTIKGEGEAVSKKYLRVTIKKFLHAQELTDTFRVISDQENALKVKKRKISED